jgi:flavin-binding protein dodecin
MTLPQVCVPVMRPQVTPSVSVQRGEQECAIMLATSEPGGTMANRTYRITEIVGTSPEGVDDAVRNGIQRAGETLRHLDWFEVTEIRGQIVDGQVQHFQVGMKLGFRLEDA